MPTGIYKRTKDMKTGKHMLGRKLSEEHSMNISLSLRGKLPKNINQIKGWNKGLKGRLSHSYGKFFSEERKMKIVETRRKNNSYLVSEETRKKMSLAHMGIKKPFVSERMRKMVGSLSHFWRGGRMKDYPELKQARLTTEYKDLLKDRMKFDDYRCMDCGERGGKLEVNHILEFSQYPRLRTEFNNLETLCKSCHKVKTKAFMSRINKLEYTYAS